MAQRGLVKKERCDSDRRGAYVAVTPEGRTELAAAALGHVTAVRRLFVDVVTPEQLAVIAQAAEAVLSNLHDNDDEN